MPDPLVVDASVTFRLILPGPEQDYYRTLVGTWFESGHELFAPDVWAYEMTSALCEAVRSAQLTPEEGRQALQLSQTLAVQLVAPDHEMMRLAFDWALRIQHRSAHDSFYLALAETLGCELWTANERLLSDVCQPWVIGTSNLEPG